MAKISCYMCRKKATTREHIPPKCFSPEKNDLPPGYDDLRRNLITVPSCQDHNIENSKDVEYILYVLCLNILGNNIALNQFLTKIVRAMERNQGLIRKIYEDKKDVIIENSETKKREKTSALKTDRDRFDKVIKMLARGLYFHVYKTKWLHEISLHAEFLRSFDKDDNAFFNSIESDSDKLFQKQTFFGSNPEVFKYQFFEKSPMKLTRLHFYNGCKILVSFGEEVAISLAHCLL